MERFKLNLLTWQDLSAIGIEKQERASLNFLFSAAVRDSLIESLRIDFGSIKCLTVEMLHKKYLITALSFLLYQMLKNPYDEQPQYQQWFAKRPEWARHKVGCSMLSCSS